MKAILIDTDLRLKEIEYTNIDEIYKFSHF